MAEIPWLSGKTLSAIAPGIGVPAYDRAALPCGIVHFGPGAFMRAHIASFVERLLPRDPRWGICGVALRHGADGPALAEQDYLYTLAELSGQSRYRVLGALRDYVVAPSDAARVLARLNNPAAKLIMITVTEKGYCLNAAGELDLAHPDIVRDLAAASGGPVSLIGWLAAALDRRRLDAQPPFVVLSCDNLASNGPKLRSAVIAFARASGRRDLAAWIEDHVRFPATMVDSITPATDEALRAKVAAVIGLVDAAPVQRESFAQWVIEDSLGSGMPDLAAAGAQLTSYVQGYEQAKLRLLNGAHSVLAYIGLELGHTTVREAIEDERLGRFVEHMMREDVASTLRAVRGLDIADYIGVLLRRLRNPAVSHRLAQIAADGSLKLPYRFLEPIAELLAAGRPVARPCVAVAAWMRFVRSAVLRGETLNDPLAGKLAQAGKACRGQAATDVPLFLALSDIFPHALAGEMRVIAAISKAYDDLEGCLR
jgi:fructuronate reductase